ncbi:MAG: hypothetical protein ACP5OX_00485 [Minisyncoccia bacterium]
MLTNFWKFVKRNWILLFFEILLLSLSFSLGIIVGGRFFQRPPLIVEKDLLFNLENDKNLVNQKGESGYVASLKGKYYYPIDCPLAKILSEKNKIYFQTKEEAESRGYIYNSRCD